MAAGLSEGWPAEEGVRLGIAMAGAVCMQLATADCRKDDIDRLLPLVQMVPFHLEN
jgi:fructose-1-phosphate kinase PfkB-like protein